MTPGIEAPIDPPAEDESRQTYCFTCHKAVEAINDSGLCPPCTKEIVEAAEMTEREFYGE